jgi:tyrosine-protein kinase Etk/Wzc
LETYAIGVGISIVLSVILLTVRFISHDTIDSVEEIEKQINVPILGSVPFHTFKGKLTKQVVTDNPKSEIAEAIRTIRTNLDFMIPNNGGKKLLSVTSTIGSEGKTFISVNLGAIISMSNKKVILIDLDMRKPKLHLALEKQNNFGMSNLLVGQMKLSEVINHSSHENLDYISAGPPPPNPSELILLTELDDIISELKDIYDVIIIDTPPIGLVTDGMIIMKKVDLSLYIVRSEYSKRAYLRSINKLHGQTKIQHLSIIFNGVKRHGGVGYGYGATYGYSDPSGYYEDSEKKSKFNFLS